MFEWYICSILLKPLTKKNLCNIYSLVIHLLSQIRPAAYQFLQKKIDILKLLQPKLALGLLTSEGLPWWLRGEEFTCSIGDVFDPLVRKIPWRRKWQPTPVFLPGKSRGLWSPWGCKESHTTERLHFHFHFSLWGYSIFIKITVTRFGVYRWLFPESVTMCRLLPNCPLSPPSLIASLFLPILL